jgi:hypothetical protein
MQYPTPSRHPNPWVDLIRTYATRAAEALRAGGLPAERCWLDPLDPRDFTILCAPPVQGSSAQRTALVWDEVTGWRRGLYLDGQQGVRTKLADVSYLGGGVLPDATALANRVIEGAAVPRREYRSVADVRDGLDDALRRIL